MKLQFAFASLVFLFGATKPVVAQDRNSVIDLLRSRGESADFSHRIKLWEELGNTDPYRGTASQNKNLRDRLLGNVPLRSSTPENASSSLSGAPQPNWLNKSEWNDWRKFHCSPRRDADDSLDVKLLDRLGHPKDSCCGASRDCVNLPDVCNFDAFYSTPQQQACLKHDKILSSQNWLDIANPTVAQAHKDLADESTDWKVKVPVRLLDIEARSLNDENESPPGFGNSRSWIFGQD